MTAQILSDKAIELTVTDQNNTVTVYGDIPQVAKTKSLENKAVIDNLNKLGGTPYYCDKIDVNIDNGLFVAASRLNALRREAIELLDNKRAQQNIFEHTLPTIYESGNLNGNKNFIARFANTQQIPQNLNGINTIIIPYNCDFPQIDNVKIIIELPRYITNETSIIKRLQFLKQRGIDTAFCSNISAVVMANACGLNVMGGFGLNANNTECIKALNRIGVQSQVFSAEISLKEIKRISADIPVGIFAYGRLPLMLTRNCPIKNGKKCAECGKNGVLVDRKGIEFPVVCGSGYSELLNSAPLYMGDRLNEIPKVDFLMFYFTTETQNEASNIIDMYNRAAKPTGDYTRNLYYRELI